MRGSEIAQPGATRTEIAERSLKDLILSARSSRSEQGFPRAARGAVDRREADRTALHPIRRPSFLAAVDAARRGTDASAADRVAASGFTDLVVWLDPGQRAYWALADGTSRRFTPALLAGLGDMQRSLGSIHEWSEAAPRFDYFVAGTRGDGPFSTGLDFALMADLVSAGDRDGLAAYASACIDVVHATLRAFERPLVSVALVQGDALGFGFEYAMSFDVLVAERGTRFGFPEARHGLFPGFGGPSILSRKLGGRSAGSLVSQGSLISAEELHRLGLVQVLADRGEGAAAVRAYIERNARRHNAQAAVYRAGRIVQPITYEELAVTASVVVENALRLGERGLRAIATEIAAIATRDGGAQAERAMTAF